MAPIFETDIPDERWSQAQWKNYEPWEKVEQRRLFQRRVWIGVTCLLMLGLLAIPVVIDQRPLWLAQRTARALATELSRLKRDAGLEHSAYRISFEGNGSLRFRVEKLDSCIAKAQHITVREGNLSPDTPAPLLLLSPTEGERAHLSGLVESFCYDSIGGAALSTSHSLGGFAIIPAGDQHEGRLDRLAIVTLDGPSANINFD